MLSFIYTLLAFPFLKLQKAFEDNYNVIEENIFLWSVIVSEKEINRLAEVSLKSWKTVHVISLASEIFLFESFIHKITSKLWCYSLYKTFDWMPVKLDTCEAVADDIDKYLENWDAVYLNCASWHWRSYMCLLYFYVTRRWKSLEEAEEFIKSQRKAVRLNWRQRKALVSYLYN